VQQVAVELAAPKEPKLDQLGEPHGSAPAGNVRRQERMASRGPDDGLEHAGALDVDRNRVVAHGAGRQLDTVPREDVCRDELDESMERTTAQLNLRPGIDDPLSEPTRSADIALSEPGHGDRLRRYSSPRKPPGEYAALDLS
jgi:hypothetical protein